LRQNLLASKLHHWQPDLIGTLVYLQRNNPSTQVGEVLLIEKRSGHGKGKINGPGGKLEATETLSNCAQRELHEEVGITAKRSQPSARIRFIELEGPQWLGFAFTTSSFSGTAQATSEALPAWYPVADLPWQRMWSSDRLWLPQVIAGQQLEVNLLFRAGKLLDQQVRLLRQA